MEAPTYMHGTLLGHRQRIPIYMEALCVDAFALPEAPCCESPTSRDQDRDQAQTLVVMFQCMRPERSQVVLCR